MNHCVDCKYFQEDKCSSDRGKCEDGARFGICNEVLDTLHVDIEDEGGATAQGVTFAPYGHFGCVLWEVKEGPK